MGEGRARMKYISVYNIFQRASFLFLVFLLLRSFWYRKRDEEKSFANRRSRGEFFRQRWQQTETRKPRGNLGSERSTIRISASVRAVGKCLTHGRA